MKNRKLQRIILDLEELRDMVSDIHDMKVLDKIINLLKGMVLRDYD